MAMPKPRLVLDTSVWLDWLVFEDPGVAPLREAAASQPAVQGHVEMDGEGSRI